ncbi:hypothetical protein DM01DRAFT_1338137 [Hesseltinella vesiculosa]|uniref:Uncharacterized protein n=1 Tax=Hesseltinella vesiculosa TaxID=101127 RepID=A0A1X2GAT2_9FUNG|nr:hypothetical protein DM01DRAFT_1338137 [Hesseltinella vesiculosa]
MNARLGLVLACIVALMALVSAEYLNMQVKYGNKKLCQGVASYGDADTYCLNCILMWEQPGVVTLRGQDYAMAKKCCQAIGNLTLADFK